MRNDRLCYIGITAPGFMAQIGYYPGELHIGRIKLRKEDIIQVMSIGARSTGGMFELALPKKAAKWLYKHTWIATRQLSDAAIKIYTDGAIRISPWNSSEVLAVYRPDTLTTKGDTSPT